MLPHEWIHVGVGKNEICGRVCRKICPIVRTRNLKTFVTPCSTDSANKYAGQLATCLSAYVGVALCTKPSFYT